MKPSTLHSLLIFALLAASPTLQGQRVHPAWSPDGKQLAYYERVENSAKVVIVDATGEEGRILAQGAWFANPTWSPDGLTLAVAYGASGMMGDWRLATIDVKTGEITPRLDLPGREMHTGWSPDGTQISFILNTGSGSDIHLLRLSDRSSRQITNTEKREFHAKWSADGTRLAHDRSGADGNNEIAIIDLSSGETNTVALPTGVMGTNPSFHPSGERLAFRWSDNDGTELATMNLDSGEIRVLTTLGGALGAPVWSPDGAWIAFHSNHEGEFGIYVMKVATGSIVRVDLRG